MTKPTRPTNGLPAHTGPGVYSITCLRNGKVYIGSALSVRGRFHRHRSSLRRGVHENQYLQRAWSKYGETAFRFDLVEACGPGDVVIKEQYWMDRLRAHDRRYGYNMCPTATSCMGGRRHTEEAKRKMSRAQRKRDFSYLTEAAAEANRGRPRTDETRERISSSSFGKRHTRRSRVLIARNHWSRGPEAAKIAASIAVNRSKKAAERMAAARQAAT